MTPWRCNGQCTDKGPHDTLHPADPTHEIQENSGTRNETQIRPSAYLNWRNVLQADRPRLLPPKSNRVRSAPIINTGAVGCTCRNAALLDLPEIRSPAAHGKQRQ
ncbi:hypothetical protein EVAR_36991_1 [Eumeta japonica]|uniref:Uncharacterized protein n=1 Tax=Eumeta variegata TaxID=151549 RepID=A0A4C1X368_EUMVA|nr:hypothetical protein EVAR_36991_1 [Eumeta japonica]